MKKKKPVLSVTPMLKKVPDPIEINQSLGINQGSLDLIIEAIVDGEKVMEFKGNSLLPNFLRLLYSFMSNTFFDANLFVNWSNGEPLYGSTLDFDTLTNVTAGSPTVLTKASSSNWGNITSYIQIMGVGGITPDINGFHQISGGVNANPEIAVSTSGTFTDQGARVRKWLTHTTFAKEFFAWGAWRLKVGRSTTANVVDQQSLVNEWDKDEGPSETNEINYGTTTISDPSLDYTNKAGEIPFAIIITNNSGASLALNEIGLYQRATFDSSPFTERFCLVARDVLPSTINLATGSNVVFNYKLRATMDSTGGFNENFIKLLYSQLNHAATSITVDDVFASTFTATEDNAKFGAFGPSGNGKLATNLGGNEGQYVGVQIGTGTTAPAFDDHNMETRIAHGEASGEMIYYGTIVDNFQIVGSVASFDLTALFENRSGGSIGVNEIGIYCYNDLGGSAELLEIAMIARHKLASTVTVNDTELLKVAYTIQLTVA